MTTLPLNRAQRRAVAPAVKAGMRGPWTPWEHRSDVVGHPSAPRGLRDAWVNNVYAVQVFYQGSITHMMVRRHDAAPVRSWSDMQRIKDELCGPDRVAVEVYPAASDLVDDANIYHLWILPPGDTLPFGLHMEDDP